MKNMTAVRSLSAVCATAIAFCAGSATAELNSIQIEVIVGNHIDTYTTDYTIPFFTEKLAEASGGKITVRAVPYTELGLSGFELMNLLKLGTNDI